MAISTPSKHGFTLIELLIVVAIIGILATVGIPTYQRMVQKSRKVEAKVALGGLYKAEVAFFSEFGVYGNNLVKIGFEMDGPLSYYSVGFADSATQRCLSTSSQHPGSLADSPSSPNVRPLIEKTFPDYYKALTWKTLYLRSGVNASAYCYPYWLPWSDNNFRASATGVIAPGIDINTGNRNLVDVWTLTPSSRIIKNYWDGVQ